MEEFNDKSQTIKFTPPHEEKQHIERTDDNIYSKARQNNEYYPPERESGSNKALVYVALILSILLIIAVAAGLIILNMDKFKNNQIPTSDGDTVIQNEIDEESEIQEDIEEEEIEEKIKINRYNVVFHSIMEKDGEYSVLADLFDESMNELDNRRLLINDETDIRENGKRLSPEGLIYAIESMAGDKIIFDANIRENDNVVMSISFDVNFEEEMNSEENINPSEGEGEDNEVRDEENPPAEESDEGKITVPELPEEDSPITIE